MRWWLLALVFLVSCTTPQAEPTTGALVYSCYDGACHEAGVGQEFPEPDVRPVSLPDVSEPRADNQPLSCFALGCDTQDRLIVNARTREWLPCDCDSARQISPRDIVCRRDFVEVQEEGFTRDPDC